MTKTEMAKRLGISRPTLDKKIKRGEKIDIPKLKEESIEKCIKFSASNNHVSPYEIENILEDLQDLGLLNQEGIEFKTNYWSLFIKK